MFKSLQTYSVYAKPSDGSRASVERCVFVKTGWSFRAAIFHVLWLLYHRVWCAAWIIFVALGGLVLLKEYEIVQTQTQIELLQLLLVIWVGFNAVDWYEAALLKRGYVLYDIFTAYHVDEAKRRFLEKEGIIEAGRAVS